MIFADAGASLARRARARVQTARAAARQTALEFRWGLPSLLPTLLSILQEASRVQRVGLRVVSSYYDYSIFSFEKLCKEKFTHLRK